MRRKLFGLVKEEFTKPTPFLLLGIFGVTFFSIVLVALLPDQTAGLGAFYALSLILIFLLAIFLDRIAVRGFRLFHVIYAEFGVIFIVFLLVFWFNRSTKVVVETELDHFVVVYLEGGKTIDDFSYVFPFSKELRFQNPTCIVLDKSLEDRDDIIIEPLFPPSEGGWIGYSIGSKLVYLKGNIRNVRIYTSGRMDAEDEAFLSCLDAL